MNEISSISASQESTRSRYPGTRPFRDLPEDQACFFGRDAEGEQLYLRVLSVSLLVQFAKSGLGKTSLLQASLFPRLRRKPFLPVMVRLDALKENLVDAVARSFEQACQAEGLKFPEVRKGGLWEFLSTALAWRGDLLLTPVLVFDQFEEVFTLRDRAFREKLAEELGALATGVAPERLRSKHADAERFKARPDVKILISLREDYLGALEEFSTAIPNLFHERLRLEPLNVEAAREAITEPAKLAANADEEPFWAPPFEFEKPALDNIIEYLEGESGVIESFALQLLSRHAEQIAHAKGERGEGFVRLTLADFNEGKDFARVLKSFYQNVLAKVEEKLGKSARSNAEELCEHGLLDRDGRRLLLERGQIDDQYEVGDETLGILAQERLIRRERRLESTFYEISHDTLAESIYSSRRNKLPKREQEQRQKEQEQLHREKQQKRRLKMVVRALGALCVVLLGVSAVALWSYTQAQRDRALAESAQALADLGRQRAEKAEQDTRYEKAVADKKTIEAEEGRQNATAQQKAAEVARQKTDGLLGFMLGENFLGEIREMGRTSTLEKVRKQWERQADETAGEVTLVRGLALRNSGDIERNKGDLKQSLEDFRNARRLIGSSPESPGRLREIARTEDRLADATHDSGQTSESLSHYQAEIEAWRQVLTIPAADQSDATEDCTALAEAIANSGFAENQMGESTRALKDLNEGLEIVSGLLLSIQPMSYPNCRLPAERIDPYPNARALMALSEIAESRAYFFVKDGETSRPLATKARQLMPPSFSASRNAFEALGFKAQTETGVAALEDSRKAEAEAEAMEGTDPDNKLLQRERAELQLLIAGGIAECAKTGACSCPADKTKNCGATLAEAEAAVLEGMATVHALAQSDPSNISWQTDLGEALLTYANVLAAQSAQGQDRNLERFEAIKQAEAIFTKLERDDDPATISDVANFFENKTKALADLRQPGDSKAAMQSALSRRRRLVAAHQGNTLYLIYLSNALGIQASVLGAFGDKVGAAAATKEQKSIETTDSELQKTADRFSDDYSEHLSQGKKSFNDRDYNTALHEFNEAERSKLNSMSYSAISSDTYEALSDIYSWVANAQSKLGNEQGQAVALGSSMHAAELAAAIDPAQLTNLYLARRDLLRFQFDRKRIEDPMLLTARQMVAEFARLAWDDAQNAANLHLLANSNFALGDFLRARNKQVGWEEAIRVGIVEEERAAVVDKKDANYKKQAGSSREALAEYLEEESPAELDEARFERQLALKDYQEAQRRNPADHEIKDAIGELGKLGIK